MSDLKKGRHSVKEPCKRFVSPQPRNDTGLQSFTTVGYEDIKRGSERLKELLKLNFINYDSSEDAESRPNHRIPKQQDHRKLRIKSPTFNRETQRNFIQFWNDAHLLVKEKIASKIHKSQNRGRGLMSLRLMKLKIKMLTNERKEREEAEYEMKKRIFQIGLPLIQSRRQKARDLNFSST